MGVLEGSVEKGVYLTIEVTIDVTGLLCTEEKWEEEGGVRLLIFKQLNNQK